MRGRHEDLAARLAAAARGSALPCWVEVTVEAPPPCASLFELVLPLAVEHGLELVRARPGGVAGPAALTAESDPLAVEEGEDWLTLLDDPAAVFARRLEAEGAGLAADDRAALTDAFRELHEFHTERRRSPDAAGVPPAPAPR